jgi:hypothetical protein
MIFDLKEVSNLAQAYRDAGLSSNWNCQFLTNVAAEGKQPRGRGVEIMAELLKKGPPTTWPSWSKAKEYLAVAETCTVPAEAQTLRDFAGRVLSGNELTDRQKAYAEKLMAGAGRVIEMVEIDEETQKLLWMLQSKMNSTSQWYWGQRTATYNRLRNIFAKAGVERGCSISATIPKEDLEYVRGSFKGHVSIWDKTPEHFGTLCQVHTAHAGGAYGTDGRYVDALVIGNRTGDGYGRIMVDCLVEGDVKSIDVTKLVFPRKSRKKKTAV